jgi:hypothetical protein
MLDFLEAFFGIGNYVVRDFLTLDAIHLHNSLSGKTGHLFIVIQILFGMPHLILLDIFGLFIVIFIYGPVLSIAILLDTSS